ncbi:hypothetical protein [Acinetobacter seifertii]|uniref:hypothetical protein n=1 Tax=Acinetobacter seifertii TaxID=1530123 RepID=UPI000C2279D3|nr:hypothetical protein [Acinetobacter seifertii]PJG65497.1 hypothetical protein CVD09_15825 [Acinetobacter seifertii]
MTEKIDLTDVILKQSTLISFFVVCYYSVFYVINMVSEKCSIELKSNDCIHNYIIFFASSIFILFVVFVFYTSKYFKEEFSEEIEYQIYLLIFLTYFTCFEITGLILTMHLKNSISVLAWLNLPIVLFCGYFYASLKIIYVELSKISNKSILAICFSIVLLFLLNAIGFMQAKEQSFDKNKKEESVLDVKKE